MSHSTFSIVWQPYQGSSPTGQVMRQTAAFPFLVDGSSQADIRAGEPTRIDARALMLGILIAYDDPPPFVEGASQDELKAAAIDLVVALKAPNLEVALLDGSAYLREHHGIETGHIALVAAAKLCPASAMIRSDLIASSWVLLKTASESQRTALLRQIAESYRESDIRLISSDAVQQLVFAVLVAFCVLPEYAAKKEEILASKTVRIITDPWYVDRVRRLLADPHPTLDSVLRTVG